MKILKRRGEHRIRKWIGLLLAICTCFSFTVPVLAAGEGTGSIQITQLDTESKSPVAGVKLTLYQIAGVSDSTVSGFAITEEFQSLSLDPDTLGEAEVMKSAVAALDQLIETRQLSGISTKTTDVQGKVSFDGLEDGIYLVKQTNTEADFEALGYTYETESYLVSLPRTGEDGTQTRTAVCSPKGSLVVENPTQLVVYKVWKDNNDKYGKRPESITVGLYNGDTLVEKVTLGAVNNWRYEWTDLDADGTWSVQELNVPNGYTSAITQEGDAVTITNTYKTPSTVTNTKTKGTTSTSRSSGKSPKTGDDTTYILWIGAAIAAVGAMWFLIAGRRKRRN